MDRKRTKGRQKIAITRISKESDCFATFSKRRLGLFKKASELSTLCNIDIGVIIFSPTGKPFSFFYPTMETVMNRLQDPGLQLEDDTSRLLDACSRTRVKQLNQMVDKLAGQLQAEEEREKQLDAVVGENYQTGGGHRGWWDEPIEGRKNEEVEQMRRWLEDMKFQLSNRLEETKRGASWSPLQFPSTC